MLLFALQAALAATLFAAAAGKALRSDEFLAALRLSHLPEAAALPLAVAVPVAEVALGFWLLLARPEQLPAAFAAAGALLLAFTGWMAWVNARRLRVRCGCFGAGEGEVGPRTMLRNAGLLALALLGWALATRVASPGLGPSLPAFTVALAFGLSVALIQAGRMALPHLVVTDAGFRASGSALAETE